MKILIFDTETTGLPKSKIISPYNLNEWPYIVQFSFIVYDSSLNIITEMYDKIIKLPENIIIPQEAINIHKVTNEMSQSSKTTLQDALKEFFYNLKMVDMLVGHNIEFDTNVLRVELMRLIHHDDEIRDDTKLLKKYKENLFLLQTFENTFCTLKETIQFCNIQAFNKLGRPYIKYPKLSELHEKLFHTTPNSLHNSIVDVLVTLRCFVKMKYNDDILTNCRTFKRYNQRFRIYE